MQKFKVNCLVIEGGVSGLAISRNLSKHFKNIFLIEKNNHIGQETSSRNSEVIHATLVLGRGIKFGPSAYEVDEVDYSINDDEKNNFYNSIKSYWPTIEKENLVPDYSGIRSIIKGSNDFVIDIGNFDENICFNILGYVSPGLTCSLSLAKYIEANLQDF